MLFIGGCDGKWPSLENQTKLYQIVSNCTKLYQNHIFSHVWNYVRQENCLLSTALFINSIHLYIIYLYRPSVIHNGGSDGKWPSLENQNNWFKMSQIVSNYIKVVYSLVFELCMTDNDFWSTALLINCIHSYIFYLYSPPSIIHNGGCHGKWPSLEKIYQTVPNCIKVVYSLVFEIMHDRQWFLVDHTCLDV